MELIGIPILAVVVCGLILFAVLGYGLFILLIQLGVIVREAQRPPHVDTGDYRLEQGREAGVDDRRD